MDIRWLGHACFVIKGAGATIVTDPYSPDIGYSLGRPEADIVTVSHQHQGHSYIQGVGGAPYLVRGPGEYEVAGVLVIGIATFHDGENGQKLGRNTVYVMDVDEISICHLGDLGHALTSSQLEEIDNVDVLLLPVGGVSTINATMAAQVVRQLEPSVVVPMHYWTPATGRELEPVERFLKEIGVEQTAPQSKLTFTKSTLPTSSQVFLCQYPEQ